MLQRNGKYFKAIECYKDALKLEPDATELDQYIGDCLVEKGKYEEALKHFYKVDYITGGSPMLWQQISWCSLNLKKFSCSNRDLNNSLRETKCNTLKHVSIISTEVTMPTMYHTCDLWVLQQQEEPISQSGARCLSPSSKQIKYSGCQVFQSKLKLLILFFLGMI